MSILDDDLPATANPLWVGLMDARADGWFNSETQELFTGFPVTAEDRVLDVGCGDGGVTTFCARQGAHLTVTDVDQGSVDAARARVEELGTAASITGVVCDSDPLLVPDGSATRVICREVLEHVADPQRVVAELFRAGTPGALYLISVPGEAGETMQRDIAPRAYFQHPNHIRVFSKESFLEVLTNGGLEVLSYSPQGFFSFFWMCTHWAVLARKREDGTLEEQTALESVAPPFDSALHEWANLWKKLLNTPEGRILKQQLDNVIPKTQVVVARKPA